MYYYLSKLTRLSKLTQHDVLGIGGWIEIIKASGIKIETSYPNSISLLDRSTLVESYDVVYRFYPPNDAHKRYSPSASLLIIIENK